MTDNAIIGAASSLRWQLPVHTPSDAATQDRMECQNIEITGRLVRDALVATPRVAHASRAAAGDQTDPETGPDTNFGIADSDADGRAAVERAQAR